MGYKAHFPDVGEIEIDCDAPGGPPVYQLGDGTYVCRCIVCAYCNKHTGNSTQGHYWAVCKVYMRQGKGLNGSVREFHFCCPDRCELEDKKNGLTPVN